MPTFSAVPQCEYCGEELAPTDPDVLEAPPPFVAVTTFGSEAKETAVGVPVYYHRACYERA
ncbi:MAG: hypothetical protein M3N47_11235 [Chloroflexota bacterium]|nr:hypothetical protein [Chloroflexota bacterium]